MKKLLLSFLLAMTAQGVFATVFTVTNTDDAGAGSLRQAILNANADLTATETSAHEINITAVGTLTLQSALPNLNNHVTITGSSSVANAFIINAGSGRRAFYVSEEKTVILRYLNIHGGIINDDDGGAIYNEGVLMVDNCYIHDNTVTGTGEGGAIYNESGATLTVSSSTFTGNSSATSGGAITNDGTAAIVNSTIYSNTAPDGGGVANSLSLGIMNCTIVDNTGEGVYHATGVSTATIIQNSIILGNSESDLYATLAYIMNASYSAIGTSANLTFTGAGNITGTNTTAIFGTVALSDNGGFTNTIALPSTSAAVDAGSSVNAPPTDQRGMNRDATPDLGAYEFQTPTSVFASTASRDGILLTSNPGNGVYKATVSEQLMGDFQWKIMDSNGRLVKDGGHFSKSAAEYTFEINIADRPNGAYYLLMYSDKGSYSQTLIKQ